MFYENINKNYGLKIFNNPNTLNYNLFNLFFKRNVASFKDDQELTNYHNLGYLKTKVDSSSLANFLKEEIDKEKVTFNEKSTFFKINYEMKNKIKDHLRSNFRESIKKFEKYYKNNVAVASVEIRRNFGLKNIDYYNNTVRSKEAEHFNMYYHCDYYTMNYFKLFINIDDVDKTKGPLNFYSIKDTKKFIKESNYKSRTNYKNTELPNVIINQGKKGESLFLNTPQCVHKAGIPSYGKYRDMLFVSFVATPEKIDDIFHYEKDYYDCIWQCKNDLPKKFSKPKNIRETFNLYKSLSK